MIRYPLLFRHFDEPKDEKGSTLDLDALFVYITSEERTIFSGDFPLHTRYFSNGDRAVVRLHKLSGEAHYFDSNLKIELPDQGTIIFDDGLPHGWHFKNSHLKIDYYREKNPSTPASKSGDYCLDHYF